MARITSEHPAALSACITVSMCSRGTSQNLWQTREEHHKLPVYTAALSMVKGIRLVGLRDNIRKETRRMCDKIPQFGELSWACWQSPRLALVQ